MRLHSLLARGVALAAMAGVALPPAGAAPATRRNVSASVAATGRPARAGLPPAGITKPTVEKWFSIGEGELITLPSTVSEVWTSNPETADVYVANPRQIHLFGKASGESTVFATDRSGAVVFAASVHVAQNSTSIDRMMKAAMPGADIRITQVGQIAVLNGTVDSPADAEQAQRLVLSLLNPGLDTSADNAVLKVTVVNRLRTATPLQVNLQVKFAEVSRSFLKNFGNNIINRDNSGGFLFGLGSGRSPGAIGDVDVSKLPSLDASSLYGLPAGSISLPFDPATRQFVTRPGTQYSFTKDTSGTRSTLSLAGRLLGMDVLSAIDLGETMGQVTTLANPNLTALSGETGTFLAGGEIPIPVSQALGTTTIEYKQFGVSLAYTPTVMSDGRISLRVRPEVSQLDYANAVTVGSGRVPALTTRRAETTVELGSGQSFMIAGLMQNTHNNTYDKTPGVADLPVIGALFKSNGFQRNETELVIVITPYLVRPVNGNDIKLPTDSYRAPSDLERVFVGSLEGGNRAAERPKPVMQAPTPAAAPTAGAVAPAQVTPNPAAPLEAPADRKAVKPSNRKAAAPAPGFSIN
ncbi:type II and III secretion system protein family protein [Sphingomonas yunnanensis]|uniref:type II and III secretion system protein family protein n=1 Tax=Sphingomonas yunnanensis TaxID=310400 RepID=UPI001CA645F9|nr:type II and III secretion system protein family protein [Sphingomonas yunnanensis]MBY9062386.1 type II and III secretion system protein family protein [Sphingomonas yunnanensis]